MADTSEATVHFSNGGTDEIQIWLEPWAQEFHLPPRGELFLRCWSTVEGSDPTPELEATPEGVTAYGAGNSRISVFINGVDQHSFSAEHTAPDAGPLSTRGFVDLVFSEQPGARPGGQITPAPPSTSAAMRFLHRVFHR